MPFNLMDSNTPVHTMVQTIFGQCEAFFYGFDAIDITGSLKSHKKYWGQSFGPKKSCSFIVHSTDFTAQNNAACPYYDGLFSEDIFVGEICVSH